MSEDVATNLMPAEPVAATAIDSDGYLYDVQTGEVLGHVEQPEEAFRISTPEGVDWALELMMSQQLKLQSIESRRSAINANLDAMLVEPRNRLKWLSYRFATEIADQARRDLEGCRLKTSKYPHGKVAFRISKGNAEIIDPAEALEFVEEWAPREIKRSVGIEGIRKAIIAEREVMDEPSDVTPFFREAELRETFTIDTTIGKVERE